jgi:hypothetical protein
MEKYKLTIELQKISTMQLKELNIENIQYTK